jgi:hypothetical protein
MEHQLIGRVHAELGFLLIGSLNLPDVRRNEELARSGVDGEHGRVELAWQGRSRG